ncbi:hypothetical protein IWW36_003058 [Coemansia brasiliensis]|uniref:Synembryn n=1 Tax=Coemansia brasiliensis TaxID=2650707 RepID=A0A9W8I8H6_9FUNG|nr:hypothetical protein IWW36_003058 [Coemansia brasiliensis]
MLDYFSLVNLHVDTELPCQVIEDGLTVATNEDYPKSELEKYTGILLQRFVYTDQDRCSLKATCLAIGLLKTFGRQLNDGGEIATQRALYSLLNLAHTYYTSNSTNNEDYKSELCSEALTCIANSMLLQPECVAFVAKEQSIDLIIEILDAGKTNSTIAFLCSRCLLLSINTKECARHCVEQHQLQAMLAAVATLYLAPSSTTRFTSQQVLTEILKAALSLCAYSMQYTAEEQKSTMKDESFSSEQAIKFASLLKVSLTVLETSQLEDYHLSGAAKQAIAIAMYFSTCQPKEIEKLWLPEDNMWVRVNALYSLFKSIVIHLVDKPSSSSNGESTGLDFASSSYQNELTPLALVLMRLAAEHSEIRRRLFEDVYPDGTIDFSELPENRSGMSAKLVRLMRNPQGGMLPAAIGDLILALLGHNIKQFIMAVGYGNAAGYMVARNIEIPADIIDSVNENSNEADAVDPVTGRYWSQEDINHELANMTDEEKEREAERLFVLFERLNKTGVIKVENPLRSAVEKGRFQELDSDESEAS